MACPGLSAAATAAVKTRAGGDAVFMSIHRPGPLSAPPLAFLFSARPIFHPTGGGSALINLKNVISRK